MIHVPHRTRGNRTHVRPVGTKRKTSWIPVRALRACTQRKGALCSKSQLLNQKYPECCHKCAPPRPPIARLAHHSGHAHSAHIRSAHTRWPHTRLSPAYSACMRSAHARARARSAPVGKAVVRELFHVRCMIRPERLRLRGVPPFSPV